MNYIYFFLLCLFSHLVVAQKSIMIDYQLIKKASKNSNTKIEKKYKLFINDEKSYFISQDKIKKDSIAQLLDEGKISSMSAFSNINLFSIDEIISYNSKSKEITSYEYLSQNTVFFKEELNINWKLTKNKKTIGNIQCSSAETEIYGKKWIAWYSTQYNFSEGPYKFKGLPGLILEISDQSDNFQFTIKSIKQIDDSKKFVFEDFTEIEKNKWKQIKLNYIENPFPELTKDLNFQTRESLRRVSIENSKNLNEIE